MTNDPVESPICTQLPVVKYRKAKGPPYGSYAGPGRGSVSGFPYTADIMDPPGTIRSAARNGTYLKTHSRQPFRLLVKHSLRAAGGLFEGTVAYEQNAQILSPPIPGAGD